MNPLAWLNPGRWMLYAAFAAALALGAWRVHHVIDEGGYDRAVAEQTARALVASEAARAKEQVLQTKVTKVANDYQLEKKRRAADAVVSAGKLRDLTSVITAATNSTTTSGADADPRLGIIAECAGAATKLDTAVKELADQTVALQQYASSVCVAAQPP
jgi:hypothetical protein